MLNDITHAIAITMVLLAAMLMHGCSSIETPGNAATPVKADDNSLQNFLDKIGTITVTDAQTALADVHAHGDVDLAAASCYPALIEFVQNSPLQPTAPTVKGVLSVNQIKRDVILGGVDRAGPFAMAFRKLHVACAGYVMDEKRFAAEFAAMIGVAGASSGAATPLIIGPAVPLR